MTNAWYISKKVQVALLFTCDPCYPSFLDSKEQRILELRAKKIK